jgi:hypothetical protein
MTERPHNLPPVCKKPKLSQRAKRHLDELLDEALKETFPASDSPAMLEPAPNLTQPEQKEQSSSQPLERRGKR